MTKNKTFFFAITSTLLVVLMGWFAFVGSFNMDFTEVINVLKAVFTDEEVNDRQMAAIWQVRLPRIIAACLAGALLAASGAAYQGVLNNPLVDPYLLGVSAGAAFGAGLAIVLELGEITYMAFGFALFASLLIYLLSWRKYRVSTLTLILAGIIINSFFLSGLAFLKYIAELNQLQALVFWLMGGLYPAKWSVVIKISIALLILLGLLMVIANKIDLMTLGGDIARTSGVNEKILVILVMVAVSFAVAVCVAHFGIIGWIGLGVPHFTRLIIGARHRSLILGSALSGAVLLLLCDTVARSADNVFDGVGALPITVVTSFIGALFFLSVLRRGL